LAAFAGQIPIMRRLNYEPSTPSETLLPAHLAWPLISVSALLVSGTLLLGDIVLMRTHRHSGIAVGAAAAGVLWCFVCFAGLVCFLYLKNRFREDWRIVVTNCCFILATTLVLPSFCIFPSLFAP
jgi:hypothetical protein